MLEITIPELDKLLTDLDKLQAGSWVADELRKAIPAIGRINKAQFDANRSLPYSASYIGRLKPSGLRVAGGSGDLGYNLDTLALYSDALFNFDVDGDSITNYSDLAYAGYQADLVEDKGSSFYADDEAYYKVLQVVTEGAIADVWGSQ
jgi:hypothetical protein